MAEVPYEIICGDVLEELKKIPSESIDVIFTSPPYNLKNSSGNGMRGPNKGKWGNNALSLGGYEKHTDSMPRGEYVAWLREIIAECFRILKPTGALFFNHKNRVQHGLIQNHDAILEGFNVRQVIIWQRDGGINFNKGYFLPTYEVIYLMPKTAKGKDSFKLKKGANAHGDVWKISQERNNPHPAPFPVELAERVISSCEGSIVLDPFAGSGTTLVAATNLGWKSIGIDSSPSYCAFSLERLQNLDKPPQGVDELRE